MTSYLKKLLPLFILAQLCQTMYAQTDSIDVFLKNEMHRRGIPGMQVAVVKNNKIVKTAYYGIANLQDAVPVTENTCFMINSMTKAFVGVAVMQLVEAGKISLTDPVSKYLDSLPAAWRGVTIKHLLQNTSGIPNIMDNNTGNLIVADDDAAAWEKVKRLPIEFKENENFSYSQTNYMLLGRIIDKQSGMPFAKYITSEQLERAGMVNSMRAGFTDGHDVINGQARVYTYFRTGQATNVFETFSPVVRTAAGMSATAKELAQWLIALQTKKLLRQEESISALWAPGVFKNGKTGGFSGLLNGYALGWPTIIRAEHPAVAAIGGARSALFVYPKDTLAIVVVTNLQGAFPETFIDEVAGFYKPDMKKANGFGFSPALKLLRSELKKTGYKNVFECVKTLQRKDKDFTLQESEINAWGYRLIEEGRKADAIEVFKLNTQMYSESANTYDSLGEAYAINGDIALAVSNYEKSFKLNPQNLNAERQIKKLRALK